MNVAGEHCGRRVDLGQRGEARTDRPRPRPADPVPPSPYRNRTVGARARAAGRRRPADRAVASRLRRSPTCRRRSPPSTTSPISISIAIDELDLRADAGGRCFARRLDRGGDRGEVDRAHVAARPRQSGRHQGRRPRDAATSLDIFAMTETELLRAGLRRSGAGRARLQAHARGRGAHRRAQPRNRSRASPGRPTCTTPSSSSGCTASAFRRWSCGAPPTS